MEPYTLDPPDQGSVKIRITPPNLPASFAAGDAAQAAITAAKAAAAARNAATLAGLTTASAPNITDFQAKTAAAAAAQAAADKVRQAAQQSALAVYDQTDTREVTHFLEYEYNDHFLVPADGSHFVLAGDMLSDADLAAMQPGARVEISIDDQPQSVAFLDEILVRGSRSSGTVVTLAMRNWLAAAVDSHVDPQLKFSDTMSLADVVSKALSQFGVNTIVDDDRANRNALTGAIYGTRTSLKGRVSKKVLRHRLSPYPQEGAFQFAARVSQRFGLWIWPTITFGTVVVGTPDFEQQPIYQLLHKNDPQWAPHNNITDYEISFSRREQPSLILASGFGGGGDFARSTLRGAIANPYITPQPPNIVDQLISVYPGLKGTIPDVTAINGAIARGPIQDPNARVLYLYDSESHNQSELDAFLRREMALRMQKVLKARYTIEGHRIGGHPIAVNTIIDVDDDRAQLHQPMWIMGRRFHKSASSGTTTSMELILPGTLAF